jgi:hypothetical protein
MRAIRQLSKFTDFSVHNNMNIKSLISKLHCQNREDLLSAEAEVRKLLAQVKVGKDPNWASFRGYLETQMAFQLNQAFLMHEADNQPLAWDRFVQTHAIWKLMDEPARAGQQLKRIDRELRERVLAEINQTINAEEA